MLTTPKESGRKASGLGKSAIGWKAFACMAWVLSSWPCSAQQAQSAGTPKESPSDPLKAQEDYPNDPLEEQEDYGGVFLPSQRTLARGMDRVRRRIAQGEFTQAIHFLNEVLRQDEDSFVVAGNGNQFAGLKETARRLIRDLPPEGRAAYQLAYRAQAERLLQSALETGDLEALSRVAQQFFYTPAGYEATLLYAQNEADHGRHLAAALGYQQLLETPEAVRQFDPQLSILSALSWLASGDSPRARESLERLKSRGVPSVQIGDQEQPLFAKGTDPLDWLKQVAGDPAAVGIITQRQWLTHRGNMARNGQIEGGLPHMRVRWKVRLLAHPKLVTLYDDLAAEFTRDKRSTAVASSPLAVGDYVITRSAHQLIAADFRTGKLVWQASPGRQQEWEQLLRSLIQGSAEERIANPLQTFTQRIWKDRLFGTVSSDGERVFAIDHLMTRYPQQNNPWQGPFGAVNSPQYASQGASNRLAAYDLGTEGRLVWEIDGQTAQGGLQGAFFLGAPLSIGQSLYALVEMKSAIYLVALDGQTGEILQRQQLVSLETGILMDPARRLQASMPSYDAGLLVCPTGAGVVVGFDLAKRSLAWAYRYPNNRGKSRVYRGFIERSQQSGEEDHWDDSSAIISGGCVLLTPPDSDQMHCLDLVTGQLLWKQAKRHSRAIACVDEDRILLVGDTNITALRLQDGKPVWGHKVIKYPAGVQPSGRGFLSQGRYYLPLTSAEVIAIDLAEGKIVSRTKSRDGEVLGNLICHRGAVLSQTGRTLDRFDQIDVLRRQAEQHLATNAEDVGALRILGEIAYNQQELPKAIELLLRAHQLMPDDLQIREVLSECLLTALDEDFASYRGHQELLTHLLAGHSADQLRLLRIQSQGLYAAGKLLESLDRCLQIYQTEFDAAEMMSIGRDRQVQVSRWVLAQSEAIWNVASEDERSEIERRIMPLVESHRQSPPGERFLRFFGGLPLSKPLWLEQAHRLLQEKNILAAQQILLQLTESENQSLRDESTALLSQLLHEAGLHRLAIELDQQLVGPLAEVICLDGKTGLQCVASWYGTSQNGSSPSAFSNDPNAQWPYGKVVVSTGPPSLDRARLGSPLWGIRLERTDAMLGSSTLLTSSRKGEVIVRDGLGQEFFHTNLQMDGNNAAYYRVPGNTYGVSRGNLLLVSMGQQMVAINTLALSGDSMPDVLWRTNLTRNFDPTYGYGRYGNQRISNDTGRPGSYRAPRSLVDGKWVGVIGPVTSTSCIYQDQRRLICVDSLSGEIAWTRTDVPLGCDLFGDEQTLLAVPRSGKTAYVYAMADGRSEGKVTLPRWKERLATRGRQVIRWRDRADNKQELSSFDALTGEVDWQFEFEKGARIDIARGRFVAVVEQIGRCTIIDAADGRRLVDQPIQANPLLREIHLLAAQESFTLLTNHAQGRGKNKVRGLIPTDYPLVTGQIYQFDRQSGQPRWGRPADVKQQAFMLTQPCDLPILLFVNVTQRRDSRGGRAGLSMLVLEKATGRTLYRADNLPNTGGSYLVVHEVGKDSEDESGKEATEKEAAGKEAADKVASREVAIEMTARAIRLNFTSQPRPPQPPALAEVEAASEKGSKGLFGILKKLGGGS